MRNAWLIRPVPHGIPRVTEFKEKGIIAVGWPCIGNLKGKSREDLKHLLSAAIQSYGFSSWKCIRNY